MDKNTEYRNRYKIKYPWMTFLTSARYRCKCKKSNNYKRYGGVGIRCLLSKEQIELLWIRDGANHLKEPSLDRKENDKDYTYENCQFIEFAENSRKGYSTQMKPINRLSLTGKFLKRYKCIGDAMREFSNKKSTNITNCIKGRGLTAYEYKWEYS